MARVARRALRQGRPRARKPSSRASHVGRQDYAATSINVLCQAVGLAKVALYYYDYYDFYVESKEHLLV